MTTFFINAWSINMNKMYYIRYDKEGGEDLRVYVVFLDNPNYNTRTVLIRYGEHSQGNWSSDSSRNRYIDISISNLRNN